MYDIERKAIEEHIAECQKRIKVIEGVMEINPDRDKEECMRNITRLKIAVSALRELQQYQAIGTVVRFKNQKSELDAAYEMLGEYQAIGTLEECREAVERQKAVPARKTTIFEGKNAEKLILMGLPNYETYKCPKCGRIAAERAFDRSLYPDGFIKKNYCENCGQKIDWSVEE